jgi:DNA-binding NarL/FixJ family response regulator
MAIGPAVAEEANMPEKSANDKLAHFADGEGRRRVAAAVKVATAEQVERALLEIAGGAAVMGVAAELGLTCSTVAGWARRAGIPSTRPHAYPPERRREVAVRLALGQTPVQIAGDLEMSAGTIDGWRRRGELPAVKVTR